MHRSQEEMEAREALKELVLESGNRLPVDPWVWFMGDSARFPFMVFCAVLA